MRPQGTGSAGKGAAASCRSTKRRVLIDAAADCFFAKGYDGTTIEDLVDKVGGSRGTIYQHFGSKRGLFEALIQDRVARLGLPVSRHRPASRDRKSLERFAMALVEFAADERWINLLRLVQSEVPRQPGLGRFLYDKALAPIESEVSAALQRWQWSDAGEASDTASLGDFFVHLLVGPLAPGLLLGTEKTPSRSKRAHMRQIVDLFLKIVVSPERTAQ